MTLPPYYISVYANIESVHVGFQGGGYPTTFVFFGADGHKVGVDQLIATIPDYPNRIVLQGNPLHQNKDFLHLLLMELTNNGHKVEVQDEAGPHFTWKVIIPGVVFNLQAKAGLSNDYYRKLRSEDIVWFNCDDRGDYDTIKREIERLKDFAKCQFKIYCPYYRAESGIVIEYWVLEDQLEIEILR